jgi:hypothetical protein
MIEGLFQAERDRRRTTNLAEGFFRHLRRCQGCFPGCTGPAPSEPVLGCFVRAGKQARA